MLLSLRTIYNERIGRRAGFPLKFVIDVYYYVHWFNYDTSKLNSTALLIGSPNLCVSVQIMHILT